MVYIGLANCVRIIQYTECILLYLFIKKDMATIVQGVNVDLLKTEKF